MKYKKMLGIVGTMLAITAMLTPIGVLANEHKDTTWSFSIATGGSGYISNFRIKQDDTSVYVKGTGGNGTFSGIVHGADSPSGPYTNKVYGGKYAPPYTIGNGYVKYMTNYNFETGSPFTKVHYDADHASYTTLSGVWSPDSI